MSDASIMDRRDDPAADSDVSALYRRCFRVVAATTPELLDAVHALRYKVYCIEHPFEDPTQQVGERESDRYDAHSAHAAIIEIQTGQVVGCVRLILPTPGSTVSELPVYSLLDEQSRIRLARCDVRQTAEISRYVVSRMFRRRVGETLYPDLGERSDREMRRLLPHLSLGLMRGIAGLAAEHGITTVCAAMSPALLRLLERFGVNFELLGPLIEHHGLRQPCVANSEQLLGGLAKRQAEYSRICRAIYQEGREW